MDFIKPNLPNTILAPPKKQKKKQLALIGNIDYCYRYRPLLDKATFEEQLEHTQSQLITYFPQDISQQYRQYQSTSKYLTISFWVTSIGFAAFCHKIPIIPRLLGQGTWKMFGFRLTSLIIPFMLMDNIMPKADEEETDYLWKNMKQRYRRYKYTGDILQLNGNINLVGESLFPNSRN